MIMNSIVIKLYFQCFSVDIQQLKEEIESQPMTVEQRTKLLDEIEYAVRVQESKRNLAEQISKVGFVSHIQE